MKKTATTTMPMELSDGASLVGYSVGCSVFIAEWQW